MFKFMAAGLLPNFNKFYQESHVYTTDAEEEGDNLNPWVQWVTVHSGLSAKEHGVKWLSEGNKLPAKATWDVLSEAGYRVWVCGSMNARYDKPLHGFLLPDPWSVGLSPYPAGEFEQYYGLCPRPGAGTLEYKPGFLQTEIRPLSGLPAVAWAVPGYDGVDPPAVSG